MRQAENLDLPLVSMEPSAGYQPVPTEEAAVASDEDAEQPRSNKRSSKKNKEVAPIKCDCASTVLQSSAFQVSSVGCILLNAVCIGFETDMPGLPLWDIIETSFLVFFTFELVLRVSVAGPMQFFTCRDNPEFVWNTFDFILVISGLVGFISLVTHSDQSAHSDATLFRMIRLCRVLRILRVIRVIRFLKQLYLLAYGFVEGAMAVFWVAILAAVIMYMCAIIIVRTYGHLPDEAPMKHLFVTYFATVPGTMFTLFEIMASPSLDPYRILMLDYPGFASFIIVFVIFGSFGINGLLTGVISESIFEKNQARIEETRMERESKRNHLMNHSAEFFEELDYDGVGYLMPDDLLEHREDIIEIFQSVGVALPAHDLLQMINIMDYNENGLIEKEEFVNFMVEMCEDIRPMSIMELHSLVTRCNLRIERCDNKVESMVRTVDDMAVQREGDARRTEELAHHVRKSHGAVQGIMDTVNNMVTDIAHRVSGKKDELDGEDLAATLKGAKKHLRHRPQPIDAGRFHSAPLNLSESEGESRFHKPHSVTFKGKLAFRDRSRLQTENVKHLAQTLVSEDLGLGSFFESSPDPTSPSPRTKNSPQIRPKTTKFSELRRGWSWSGDDDKKSLAQRKSLTQSIDRSKLTRALSEDSPEACDGLETASSSPELLSGKHRAWPAPQPGRSAAAMKTQEAPATLQSHGAESSHRLQVTPLLQPGLGADAANPKAWAAPAMQSPGTERSQVLELTTPWFKAGRQISPSPSSSPEVEEAPAASPQASAEHAEVHEVMPAEQDNATNSKGQDVVLVQPVRSSVHEMPSLPTPTSAVASELQEQPSLPAPEPVPTPLPAQPPVSPPSVQESALAPTPAPAAAASSAQPTEPVSEPVLAQESAPVQSLHRPCDKDASLEEARQHLKSLTQIQKSLHEAGDLTEVRLLNDLVSTALARLVLDGVQILEKGAQTCSTAADAGGKI